MLLYGTREDNLLQILSFIYKVFDRVFMSDTHHVLFDNRTCVQFGRYIMTGCTDNLHPSLESGMVRLRTYERRKERVVNIDYLLVLLMQMLFVLHTKVPH